MRAIAVFGSLLFVTEVRRQHAHLSSMSSDAVTFRQMWRIQSHQHKGGASSMDGTTLAKFLVPLIHHLSQCREVGGYVLMIDFS